MKNIIILLTSILLSSTLVNAEEKKTRTNLKKLGCLFEALLGAIFLEFNKIEVKDEERWFDNLFITGPGFQMAQIFIENIFAKHVDWKLIDASIEGIRIWRQE